jgi:hypothetical protein
MKLSIESNTPHRHSDRMLIGFGILCLFTGFVIAYWFFRAVEYLERLGG